MLESINSPEDLRSLKQDKLPALASEIRDFMIDAVSKCGGHLAPSLGACDLAIALHYCYNTPDDKIVWDVGHQAYAHKILTGRKESFSTIRQHGGLSGFPRISESPYDALSVGHASTSISAALGMALARDLKKENNSIVAVIGDGSLSGGLALEGLNNVGSSNSNLTVVLNDNKMSISRNVGALSRYLTRILTDRRFNKLRKDVWDMLGNMSDVGKRIRSVVSNIDEAVKHMVIPGKLFEDMGLRYLGPIDGHNIDDMIEVFKFTRNHTDGPILVHVITKKGKGYSFAENDATKYHGVGKFSIDTGLSDSSKSGPSYSSLFGSTLVEIGAERKDVVAITAAMPDGTGLAQFRDTYPDRFFDVGIAEGHAVTFAAGLALGGFTPVVALYSSFLQRAYDQVMHDIALDNLHVVFGIDRAGLVGEDGPTHHGAFDLSYLRAVPNATILAPSNENQFRSMLHTAIYDLNGPVFIRYPRGTGPGQQIMPITPLHGLTPRVVREGKNCAVVALGDWLGKGEQLCDHLRENGINPTLVDGIAAKPLDKDFYLTLFANYTTIVTLENNAVNGGFGSAILELASESSYSPQIIRFGLPDTFVKHGKVDLLLQDLNLTIEDMTRKVLQMLKKK